MQAHGWAISRWRSLPAFGCAWGATLYEFPKLPEKVQGHRNHAYTHTHPQWDPRRLVPLPALLGQVIDGPWHKVKKERACRDNGHEDEKLCSYSHAQLSSRTFVLRHGAS